MWPRGMFVLDGRVPHALRPCYLRRSVGAPSVPMQGMMHMHAHVPSMGPAVPPCEVLYTSTKHICDDPRIWKQKRRVQAQQAALVRARSRDAAIWQGQNGGPLTESQRDHADPKHLHTKEILTNRDRQVILDLLHRRENASWHQ